MRHATMFALILAAALGAVGCQSAPPSELVPVPVPLMPVPSSSLSVVGVGDTEDEAREAALRTMVLQVILPPAEPEEAVTPEFIASMIRGYDVTSVKRDFTNKCYVTVKLPISQLGANYQELYAKTRRLEAKLESLRQHLDSE